MEIIIQSNCVADECPHLLIVLPRVDYPFTFSAFLDIQRLVERRSEFVGIFDIIFILPLFDPRANRVQFSREFVLCVFINEVANFTEELFSRVGVVERLLAAVGREQPLIVNEFSEILPCRLVVDVGLVGNPRGATGLCEHLGDSPDTVLAFHIIEPYVG
ncbi:hypothetical protein OB960_22950 [Halobacteria archaeon AArc-xg1-1]|uniref:Uncharacterized protein n=1 Tax=Natronoglomus mannanivorans TaxID=2979990 RepID=A0AAP2Z5B0_9EURY|nr:hypothetical protein [Halobacteria archaeon AArc-xg1-1]